MFRTLDERMLVSPQIGPEAVHEAYAQGVRLVINNRPDHEDAGQPEGAEIAAVCERLGIGYVAIPVTHAGFSTPQVDAMAVALGREDKVLAYCRSGTRSTLLWSLARAQMGDDPDALAAKAAGAGYDLTPVRAMLDMIAGAR